MGREQQRNCAATSNGGLPAKDLQEGSRRKRSQDHQGTKAVTVLGRMLTVDQELRIDTDEERSTHEGETGNHRPRNEEVQ